MESPSIELFRMVHLRGADSDKIIDPSDDPGVTVKVLRSTSFSELNSKEGAQIVKEATADKELLEDETLAADYPWGQVLEAIRAKDNKALKAISLDYGHGSVAISEYAKTAKFRDLYDDLYNSWLLIALQDRYLQQQPPDTLEKHAELLRSGHIISLIGNKKPSMQKLFAVSKACIVLPNSWERATEKKRPTSIGKKSNTGKLRFELIKKIDEHKAKVEEIATLASLQLGTSIYFSTLERMPNKNSLSRKISDTDIEKIIEKSPGVHKEQGKGILSKLKDKSLSAEDLSNELTVTYDKGVSEANSICQTIQLYEETIREKLPPPDKVESANRPSIRDIGFGELIVAKSRLSSYTTGEIAHIENILPAEKKLREHERTTSVEEIVEIETTEETTSERDLETSDRFELQSQASETIDKDFSIEAGVNTSGQYGLTQVDTSLDAKFSSSDSNSFETTTSKAQDIVSKSLERTITKVRELRKTTTVEKIRELANHTFDNTESNAEAISGIYYWVDKIEEVQLRHYGRRLMVEFYIPEPGVSLIEEKQSQVPELRKPKPLAVGPNDINPGNYLCLAKTYGATGVQPPPPLWMQSGIAFATKPDDKRNEGSNTTVKEKIKISDGYIPYIGSYSMTGRGSTNTQSKKDTFNGHIAVAGQMIINKLADEHEDTTSYEGTFHFIKNSYASQTGDLGLPVTGRWSQHNDNTGTLNINVWSKRSNHLFQLWKISVYERLKEAHQQLVEEYEAEMQRQEFIEETSFEIGGNPPSVNREIEKNELKKWAVKLMRVAHFDFDAIVGIGENEDELQEIGAAVADEYAPIVRFYENAFEWKHMSFFLYPYFWGRRGAWGIHQRLKVPNDMKHEHFLKAGYARVVVPVAPGFEARMLQFLKPGSDLGPESSTDYRIPDDEDLDAESPASAEALWEELRNDRDAEVARGNGRLIVTKDSKIVKVNEGNETEESLWKVSEIDIGREIFIEGQEYKIIEINDQKNEFTLDREYEGADNDSQRFLVGSTPFGEPWSVTVPTRLVILRDNVEKLNHPEG